jgi:hypothetical protein
MFPAQQFRAYYRHLADDELARIALESELVPEARRALTDELQYRGLTDLSGYKRALDEAALYRKVENQGRAAQMPLHWLTLFFLLIARMIAPFLRSTLPSVVDALKISAVSAVLTLFGCYVVVNAYPPGAQRGHRQRVVATFILLGISTIAVVTLKVLRAL